MFPVGAVVELEEANIPLCCPLKLGRVVDVQASSDDSSMLEESCNEQTEENVESSGDKENKLGRNYPRSFPKSRTFLHNR